MTTCIAVLAACASTLALAQADLARAGYDAAPGSRAPASTAERAIVFAQSAPVNTSRSDKKAGLRKNDEGGGALAPVSTTRGRKLQSSKSETVQGNFIGTSLRKRETGGTLPKPR
jgi:hypothetical protein